MVLCGRPFAPSPWFKCWCLTLTSCWLVFTGRQSNGGTSGKDKARRSGRRAKNDDKIYSHYGTLLWLCLCVTVWHWWANGAVLHSHSLRRCGLRSLLPTLLTEIYTQTLILYIFLFLLILIDHSACFCLTPAFVCTRGAQINRMHYTNFALFWVWARVKENCWVKHM